MPHLWMFLLRALTPAGLQAILIDGNAQPMDEASIARRCFRGIYFPQMGRFAWLTAILENRRTIFKLIREGVSGGLRSASPTVTVLVIAGRQN